MKKNLLLYLLCLGFNCIAQYPENLIPNSSFEYADQKDSPSVYCSNLRFLKHWKKGTNDINNTPNWRSFSDLFTSSNCYHCRPNNINLFTSDKYIHLGLDEFFPSGESTFARLNEILQKDKKYKFRILANGRPGDFFSIHLAQMGNGWNNVANSALNMGYISTWTFPSNTVWRQCKVIPFETVITVNKDELEHFALSVDGGADGKCTFLFDDVELYEYCTDYLIRQNRIYRYSAELEEANTIIAGSRVNNIAAGDVNMLDGSVTTYQGKQEVQLVEGFNVNRGADFTAKIVGSCGSFCTGTNIDIPTEYTICDNGCLQLNGRLMRGLTYTWSSTPVSYVEFLSAIDIPNPTFCPPANIPEGIYTFHLTVSNDCGETTTKTVNIYHSPNSNANPNFTITNSNLASKPDFPEFTINVPSQTELVVVDLMDCNGNVLRNNTYKYGVDFSEATSIDWKINDYLTPCNCYKIRVKTKNICYPNWKEETYDWDRIRTPSNIGIPNFAVCINGKRHLCFRGEGISHIQIELFNRWDRQVVNSTLNFTNNPFCFEVPKHEDKELPDGTYWMIVTITGCDGTKKVFTTSVFLPSCDQLVGDNPPGNGDTYIYDGYYPNPETGALDSLYTSISPNPLTETSIIKYHIPKAGNVKLTLLNANFEQKAILVNQNNVPVGDFEVQTSAANLANGVNYYMLELVNEKHAVIIKRFSVIK